jgi:hypothetical protein
MYDALELHGILPIKNLRSYRFSNGMECSIFPRNIGPGIARLEFDAALTYSPRSLTRKIDFPSLRVLKLPRSRLYDGADPLKGSGDASAPLFFRPSPRTLGNLEVFHSGGIIRLPHDMLEMVLASTALRELELNTFNMEVSVSQCIRSMHIKPSFQLQRLSICGDITQYTEILREIDATSLRDIQLDHRGPRMVLLQGLESLFQTIGERCSPSALR